MFRPLFCVPLAIALVLLQQVPTASGTYAITLTAAQSTALAAVAVLGIKAKLIGGYLLSRRGKRSAEEKEVPSIETFAALEVEDCYKRVICAASTGEVENPQVQNVLALFNPVQFMQAPLSHKAMKLWRRPGTVGPAGAWPSASTGTPAASAWTSSRTCSELWGHISQKQVEYLVQVLNDQIQILLKT